MTIYSLHEVETKDYCFGFDVSANVSFGEPGFVDGPPEYCFPEQPTTIEYNALTLLYIVNEDGMAYEPLVPSTSINEREFIWLFGHKELDKLESELLEISKFRKMAEDG